MPTSRRPAEDFKNRKVSPWFGGRADYVHGERAAWWSIVMARNIINLFAWADRTPGSRTEFA